MPVSTQALPPRRRYNQWVADETLEDFALRFTARRARRWSFSRIANTALGTTSFLVLELLGATIAINYGVENSLWAILVFCVLLFLTGLPISYYATRYGVDIDLLTRGAGFGYIGSTISSLIYASFTFIFFALEAAIMATALESLMGIPLWLGYIVSAVVVIPLVIFGISLISRFQLITQPLWLLLQLLPFVYVFSFLPEQSERWLAYPGKVDADGFNWLIFGSATAVLFSLMAQIGEQVDFLRFLPEPKNGERKKWWLAILLAGPGWVFIGALKLVLGVALAYLLIAQGFALTEAQEPTRMYQVTFSHYINSPLLAIIVATLFIVVCQIKINVANAYAGSLAWSNFFSRLTHHHPGRVVWLIFNVTIALLLMELGLYKAIDSVLHHYSAFVLAWLGSIVADLVINKPLGLSPKHIEFRRSHLWDINPVGFVSTILAALLGVLASIGWMGETAKSFSAFIALLLPFVTVPIIAWLTRSRYYLNDRQLASDQAQVSTRCSVCENHFDPEDISYCPAYEAPICSLCCALETKCEDQCRPELRVDAQVHRWLGRFLPARLQESMSGTLGRFTLGFLTLAFIVATIFLLSYTQIDASYIGVNDVIQLLVTIFALLCIILGVMVWLFVLAQSGTRFALQEYSIQTHRLTDEIEAHEDTFKQLEHARKSADSANVAKSEYVTALSHELRTPLNVILGYAQILENDTDVGDKSKESLAILRRNGEHLATMIEGLLEISKIEAGRMSLNRDEVRLDRMLDQLSTMFAQQAKSKGLEFNYSASANLPNSIATDEKRLRQILINLLSNAIKFTLQGEVKFSVHYRGHVIRFVIEDTGLGMSPHTLKKIFVPFERGDNVANHAIPGSGLGLAICRQLADMMGADIAVESELHKGTKVTLRLQAAPIILPQIQSSSNDKVIGYEGHKRCVLVVDDNGDHRRLVYDLLSPLDFMVIEADSKKQCIQLIDNNAVDLVLLDIALGQESGWHVLERIRETDQTIPVIMVSANVRELRNSPESKTQPDSYLEKPIQFTELLERIANQLKLSWIYEYAQTLEASIAPNTDKVRPSTESQDNPPLSGSYKHIIGQLKDYAKIGHLNGFMEALGRIKKNPTADQGKVAELETAAKRFDFSLCLTLLDEFE